MIDDTKLLARAERLVARYAKARKRIVTAESCTGGLIVGLLTSVPGSSAVVERGFVTYSNAAKIAMVDVPGTLIEAHGAVSEPVARAMAEGALAQSEADVAVAVTGVAGPSGGSMEKPVGLVHFGFAAQGSATRHMERRYGDLGRAEVRWRSVEDALTLLEDALGDD